LLPGRSGDYVLDVLLQAFGRSFWALKKFLHRESDIFDYLPEQYRRYVPPAVKGYGGAASIRMAELFVRSPLSDLLKTESFEHTDDLIVA